MQRNLIATAAAMAVTGMFADFHNRSSAKVEIIPPAPKKELTGKDFLPTGPLADAAHLLDAPAPISIAIVPPDFEKMTKTELINWAEGHDVTVRQSWTKAKIIEALKA